MFNDYENFSQGDSHFFLLKNNAVKPNITGGTHWLELLPDWVYCFVPSMEIDKGTVHVYDHMPEFVKDFDFCMEIFAKIDSVATMEHKTPKK